MRISVELRSQLSQFPESLRVPVRLPSASASPRDNLSTTWLPRIGITSASRGAPRCDPGNGPAPYAWSASIGIFNPRTGPLIQAYEVGPAAATTCEPGHFIESFQRSKAGASKDPASGPNFRG